MWPIHPRPTTLNQCDPFVPDRLHSQPMWPIRPRPTALSTNVTFSSQTNRSLNQCDPFVTDQQLSQPMWPICHRPVALSTNPYLNQCDLFWFITDQTQCQPLWLILPKTTAISTNMTQSSQKKTLSQPTTISANVNSFITNQPLPQPMLTYSSQTIPYFNHSLLLNYLNQCDPDNRYLNQC